MKYEGRIYRPPSEAHSLIVQVTVGCSHNGCTFCEMYKDKKFKFRPINEILADFDSGRKQYRHINRIFLADGDSLIEKTENLLTILDYIKKHIPECERITSYASPMSILLKKPEELELLKERGLDMVYLGLESGSDTVLKNINKGEVAQQIISAGKRVKVAGIKLSVTVISGLGGTELIEEHAIKTGQALSEIKPDYIGLLTLMLYKDTPMRKDYLSGKFSPLSNTQVMEEMHLMISHMDCEGAVLRANHASNQVPIGGVLNRDKAEILEYISTFCNKTK